MTKKYKNDGLMKFLTIIGALIGLVSLILWLAKMPNYGFVNPVFALDQVVTFIIGLVVVVLTFLAALKPNNPIPFHWLILFILGVLLVIFGAGIWAGILVIIAALIGLIEDL